MKRYENMGKKEIVDTLINSLTDCTTCPCYGEYCTNTVGSCSYTLGQWMNEEINDLPNITVADAVEVVEKALREYKERHSLFKECFSKK